MSMIYGCNINRAHLLLNECLLLWFRVTSGDETLYYGEGICGNTQWGSGLLEGCFRSWSKFSGREVYPVPAPRFDDAPEFCRALMDLYGYDSWDAMPPSERASAAYGFAASSGNQWIGAYGDLRKELLAHVIKTLQEQIKLYEKSR